MNLLRGALRKRKSTSHNEAECDRRLEFQPKACLHNLSRQNGRIVRFAKLLAEKILAREHECAIRAEFHQHVSAQTRSRIVGTPVSS